uniref:DUF5641 domain-containing protein n=1 Tax=Anopheles quadriannulatus TaxID=34691 RepID=A0A182WYE9_ANOQN
MTTLLAEIECCLNSRPLTPMTEDLSDAAALTPGHFLVRSHLQQLQARAKYCNGKSAVLKENTLVIIKEDNVHPTSWPMGRIVAVHPGKDDVVRVVTLRTASGKQIVRAANRLAVLPNPD